MNISESKNLLQEKFQKLGLDLPKYTTSVVDDGNFVCELVLCSGEVFHATAATKKSAEKTAAIAALHYTEQNLGKYLCDLNEKYGVKQLLEMPTVMGFDPSGDAKTNLSNIWIIVDLENIGNEKQFMKLNLLSKMGFTVSGVASSNYKNLALAKQYIPNVAVVASSVREASDVYICFAVAKEMFCYDTIKRIFIVSQDRFSRAAADIANLQDIRENYDAIVYSASSVDQLIMNLIKLSEQPSTAIQTSVKDDINDLP